MKTLFLAVLLPLQAFAGWPKAVPRLQRNWSSAKGGIEFASADPEPVVMRTDV